MRVSSGLLVSELIHLHSSVTGLQRRQRGSTGSHVSSSFCSSDTKNAEASKKKNEKRGERGDGPLLRCAKVSRGREEKRDVSGKGRARDRMLLTKKPIQTLSITVSVFRGRGKGTSALGNGNRGEESSGDWYPARGGGPKGEGEGYDRILSFCEAVKKEKEKGKNEKLGADCWCCQRTYSFDCAYPFMPVVKRGPDDDS